MTGRKCEKLRVFIFAGEKMIYLVQGDTGPQLKFTITETDSGTAIDLTGGSVTMHFRAAGTTTVLFSRAATLTDPSNGEAVLTFQSTDLDRNPGSYEAEVEVVLASGLRQTIYETLAFTLREDFA